MRRRFRGPRVPVAARIPTTIASAPVTMSKFEPRVRHLHRHDAARIHPVHSQFERQPESLDEDQDPQRYRGRDSSTEAAEGDREAKRDDRRRRETRRVAECAPIREGFQMRRRAT